MIFAWIVLPGSLSAAAPSARQQSTSGGLKESPCIHKSKNHRHVTDVRSSLGNCLSHLLLQSCSPICDALEDPDSINRRESAIR